MALAQGHGETCQCRAPSTMFSPTAMAPNTMSGANVVSVHSAREGAADVRGAFQVKVTVVPWSTALRTCAVPPMLRSRAAVVDRPERRGVGTVKPRPRSVTVTVACRAPRTPRTVACATPLCRAMFESAWSTASDKTSVTSASSRSPRRSRSRLRPRRRADRWARTEMSCSWARPGPASAVIASWASCRAPSGTWPPAARPAPRRAPSTRSWVIASQRISSNARRAARAATSWARPAAATAPSARSRARRSTCTTAVAMRPVSSSSPPSVSARPVPSAGARIATTAAANPGTAHQAARVPQPTAVTCIAAPKACSKGGLGRSRVTMSGCAATMRYAALTSTRMAARRGRARVLSATHHANRTPSRVRHPAEAPGR